MFSIVKCGERPRWRMTSFIAWITGSREDVKSELERSPLPFVEVNGDVEANGEFDSVEWQDNLIRLRTLALEVYNSEKAVL